MGNPDKESEQRKEAPNPEEAFFAGPQVSKGRGSFADPQAEHPGAQSFNLDSETEVKAQTADENHVTEPGAKAFGSEHRPSLPPKVQNLLMHYLETSKKLLMSPLKFFKEMESSGGLREPCIFLAVSASTNGILSALVGGFNLGLIPRECLFVGMSCFVISALVYMLAKGMGSKCSFEVVFKVLAYCSCLTVIAPIPGIGFLAPIAGLVLYFFGLKEVLGVTLYQTCTIMGLVGLMQVLLTIGHMLAH